MNKTDEIKDAYSKFVMPTYSQELAITKGKGAKVWDSTGKVYLDFTAGIAVLNVGYSHPKLLEAMNKQSQTLMHVSNLYFNEAQGQLARKLVEISGLGGKCFFCNSGAEANEGLIKLARLWGHEKGRNEIIAFRNSFHGRTLATIAATGQNKVKVGYDPLPAGFSHAELNNLESVKALITPKTAAILVEAIQGEGGVNVATNEFMKDLRALCNEKDILLLCDEVQCGMGRTGEWFGFEASDVEPDAFSIAKSLGSGYPIGAVVAGKKLADVFHPGAHASTFGGSPLACTAALTTIDIIEQEGLLAKARRIGELFKEGLLAFAEKYEHVKDVRGRGLMLGLVLDQPAAELAGRLRDVGLLAIATAENVIRFLPPLNITDNELEEALEMIDDCLLEWHGMAEPETAEAEAPAQA